MEQNALRCPNNGHNKRLPPFMKAAKEEEFLSDFYYPLPISLAQRTHPDATSRQAHVKYLKISKQATTYYISGYSSEFS